MLPPVEECEVVEKELWDLSTEYQIRKMRKSLWDRGFILARQCWYHPKHWRVEDWSMDDPGPDDPGKFYEYDEVYTPLTPEAQAWLMKTNAEMEAEGF